MTAEEEFEAIILPFYDAPKDHPPDVRALARLLRSNVTLPEGFRATLAEMLDSQLPFKLAMNWTLKPEFIGRYDEEADEEKVEKALAREGNITRAVFKVDGMSDRTAWRIWDRIKLKQSWLKTTIASFPISDDLKKRVRRAWGLND